jgi:enoyl-CoA hydratase/carnithine racemase
MTIAPTSTPLPCTRSEEGIVSIHLAAADRPVVILDTNLLRRLEATLDAVHAGATEEPLRGAILRSDCSRVFVAGADLVEIDGLDDEALQNYLAEGSRIFMKLATLPCPTVAAIDGATLGGGLEIAMHCDGLIATRVGGSGKPYPIGLPECSLGLCPGWGGTQMLPARIDPLTAIRMTVAGTPARSDDVPEGLVDRFVDDADALLPACLEWIEASESVDRSAETPRCLDHKHPGTVQAAVEHARTELEDTSETRAILDCIEIGLRDGWAAALAAEQQHLVALRGTESTRTKLDAFFSKQG